VFEGSARQSLVSDVEHHYVFDGVEAVVLLVEIVLVLIRYGEVGVEIGYQRTEVFAAVVCTF
jgi:hypothetical protein